MFKHGLIKSAFWFGKKKEKKVVAISKEHEKFILPYFKKHDSLRKKENEKNLVMDNGHPDHSNFTNAVAYMEDKHGIPNTKLYEHMYKNFGYDRNK